MWRAVLGLCFVHNAEMLHILFSGIELVRTLAARIETSGGDPIDGFWERRTFSRLRLRWHKTILFRGMVFIYVRDGPVPLLKGPKLWTVRALSWRPV